MRRGGGRTGKVNSGSKRGYGTSRIARKLLSVFNTPLSSLRAQLEDTGACINNRNSPFQLTPEY